MTWVDRWEVAVPSKGLSRGSLYFEHSSETDLLSIWVIELFFSRLVVSDSQTTAHQATLSLTISQSLLKFVSIKSVMPSNHLILCQPLLLLPSAFPSFGVFSNKLTLCMKWPEYHSFSFSISPSNEYSGFISFEIDWFDFLAVQGSLKSFFQLHSLKASILWCSTFMVPLSHPYLTTGKIHGWNSSQSS